MFSLFRSGLVHWKAPFSAVRLFASLVTSFELIYSPAIPSTVPRAKASNLPIRLTKPNRIGDIIQALPAQTKVG